MSAKRTTQQDPRKVGGTYWSAYWQQTYTVYAKRGYWLTVQWADDRITNHCTSWDKHDRIISEPTSEGI